MSREGSHHSNNKLQPSQNNVENTGEVTMTTTQEALAVIREEKDSPATSSTRMVASKATIENPKNTLNRCVCGLESKKDNDQESDQELHKILKEKEAELRTEYDKILEKEMHIMKERFDNILANEQTRASYMLREAQRERQERINALRSQLECKNLAALMYVMCTERKKSKLEKLRLIRDYTNYIHGLQDILSDGQELILHLSRGYKTAARVDYEWREKMKKVVTQFMSFIYHFCGGDPETNQFFIDLPKLLTTEAPIVDNPNEDPCEDEEEVERPPIDEIQEKSWWETLEDEERPFVVFGDMADFKPPERRDIIKRVKAAKTAPKKWKQYCFNDIKLTSTCNHLDAIKDIYPKKQSMPIRLECRELFGGESKELRSSSKQISNSVTNATSRRITGQSIDIRGTMGSLLKIITTAQAPPATTKTALLGARDSMEITSTTKLRERTSLKPAEESEKKLESKEVVLAIGRRKPSLFDQTFNAEEMEDESAEPVTSKTHSILEDDQEEEVSLSPLGSIHNDSLPLLQTQPHVPELDHKIVERICPMQKCQRMQVDSFMRSLPPYMRANPFTHFECTFDGYETCTPEQLEMLKKRIESRKIKEEAKGENESPLQEWVEHGVAVQTSDLSMSLPPCTCQVPTPTPVPSNFVFDFKDLLPVKAAIDAIHNECLYDKRIDFDRFKVIGVDNKVSEDSKKEFKEIKYEEVKKILKQHPSLLDIFQANTQC